MHGIAFACAARPALVEAIVQMSRSVWLVAVECTVRRPPPAPLRLERACACWISPRWTTSAVTVACVHSPQRRSATKPALISMITSLYATITSSCATSTAGPVVAGEGRRAGPYGHCDRERNGRRDRGHRGAAPGRQLRGSAVGSVRASRPRWRSSSRGWRRRGRQARRRKSPRPRVALAVPATTVWRGRWEESAARVAGDVGRRAGSRSCQTEANPVAVVIARAAKRGRLFHARSPSD